MGSMPLKPIRIAETKTKPLKKRKNDSFARQRLARIRKYKFEGLYFGGVDFKPSECITVPSQKTIRTRSRRAISDKIRTSAPIQKFKKPPMRKFKRSQSNYTPPSSASLRPKSTRFQKKNNAKQINIQRSQSTKEIHEMPVFATVSSAEEDETANNTIVDAMRDITTKQSKK